MKTAINRGTAHWHSPPSNASRARVLLLCSVLFAFATRSKYWELASNMARCLNEVQPSFQELLHLFQPSITYYKMEVLMGKNGKITQESCLNYGIHGRIVGTSGKTYENSLEIRVLMVNSSNYFSANHIWLPEGILKFLVEEFKKWDKTNHSIPF